MSYICDSCEKTIQVGHHIRHHRGVAGGRWKRKAQKTNRVWLPNLHSVRVMENGKIVRRRLCTKCMRRADRPKKVKEEAEDKKPVEKTEQKAEARKKDMINSKEKEEKKDTKKVRRKTPKKK